MRRSYHADLEELLRRCGEVCGTCVVSMCDASCVSEVSQIRQISTFLMILYFPVFKHFHIFWKPYFYIQYTFTSNISGDSVIIMLLKKTVATKILFFRIHRQSLVQFFIVLLISANKDVSYFRVIKCSSNPSILQIGGRGNQDDLHNLSIIKKNV